MISLSEARLSPAFRKLNDQALQSLLGVMVERDYTDGEVIVRQGERADGVYLLVHGHIRISRRLPDSSTVGLVTLGQGALFGTLAALDGRARAANCIAWGSVRVGFMSLTDFGLLMEGDSPSALQFQMAVLQNLFTDIRVTNQRLAELTTLPEIDLSAVGTLIAGLT